MTSLPGHVRELRDRLSRDETRDAILVALAGDVDLPADSARFALHLREFRQEGTRALMRNGYRLRLAERKVMGTRKLVPLGKVDELLRSSLPTGEKTIAIAEHLDEHATAGLGDPARLYVLAPFGVVRELVDDFVAEAVRLNGPSRSNLDIQTETYARYLTYGYVYRVAEELVSAGLPVDWKKPEDEAGPPGLGPPWTSFGGRGNSSLILYEKARVVTSLVEMIWDSGLVLAVAKDSQIRLGEDEARSVFSETAILFIRLLDEIAFGALGAELSDEFMDSFAECVGRALEEKGVPPDRFVELLRDRMAEYSGYTKWIPEKGGGSRGTLFWEFGKRIADIVGIGRSAIFNVLLTNVLMGSLVDWRLAELLQAR
jgi:hypothetical protein